eukprot:496295_1
MGVAQAWKVVVFLPLEITFAVNYMQLFSTYQSVACQYRTFSFYGIKVNSSTLSFCNAATVITWVPFLNYIVYPYLKKKGGIWYPTALKKVGVGFTFTSIAQYTAAYLEVQRKAAPYVMTMCNDETKALGYCTIEQIGEMVPQLSFCYEYVGEKAFPPVPVHDLPVILMGIPFGIFALSEISLVAFSEVFYSQVPATLSGVCQATNFFAMSLGATLSGVLTMIFKEYLTSNCNEGHYEYFFSLIGTMEVINFFTFLYVAHNFAYLPGTSGHPDDQFVYSNEEGTTTSSTEGAAVALSDEPYVAVKEGKQEEDGSEVSYHIPNQIRSQKS